MDITGCENSQFNCDNEQLLKFPRFPPKSDFEPGGELADCTVPYLLPIPSKIVKFIYGTDTVQQSKMEWIKLLTHLNEIVGVKILYCDCGQHLLRKAKIPVEPPDSQHFIM